MSRLFWIGVGAAIGVYVTRRVDNAARHLTPRGFADDMTDALHDLAGAVGSFGADVRAGMVERERELHRMVDDRTGIPTGDGDSDAGAVGGAGGGSGAVTPRRGARASRAANQP
jgi:hypothetical protein